MLKLYGGARSRAVIVRWYLTEIEIPYEFVTLDMQAGEHLQPEFLAINLFGKVPALVDGGLKLAESGAILLYLAEKYGQPNASVEERATLAQWVLFANSTLSSGIFSEATREKETPRLLAPLNEWVKHRPFLLGDEFSAADVAVGSVLAWIPVFLKQDLLIDYPALLDYRQRLAKRPGYQKTMPG